MGVITQSDIPQDALSSLRKNGVDLSDAGADTGLSEIKAWTGHGG